MIRLICLAIGYMFGLFQSAYIYGKAKGIDIRKHGSGNAGTTNTLRVLGTKAGLIVFAGDVLKCMFAVVLVRILFVESYPNMIYLLMLYAATGAILGHNFPFYLKFKGGKGIAATAGLILSFHPLLIPIPVIVFFSIFFITHYVSLGSIMVYVVFIVQMVVGGQMGIFGEMVKANLFELYGLAAFLTIMAIWKHKENIVRLLKGTERKTYLSKKSKEES